MTSQEVRRIVRQTTREQARAFQKWQRYKAQTAKIDAIMDGAKGG